ncbi:MAG: terpene cyclase/mutase family protein [Anaerolineae bacterium]|nr:terpene cyclase/mutase family protein [Anaerolineae bacterium]
MSRGEDLNGLCFGLTSMINLGAPVPPTALGGLVALQNEDGGFGTGPGAESQLDTTGLCVQVLSETDQTEAEEAALGYLEAEQNEDGGWGILAEGTSDALATSLVVTALLAAEEDLAEWDNPEMWLFMAMNEDGTFDLEDPGSQLFASVLTAMAFRGASFVTPGQMMDMDEMGGEGEDTGSAEGGEAMAMEEGPALDANWAAVSGGFGMPELNTADDFFVTVVDPFTDDELYGVEIINWTADYQYTGFIVEQFLTAEVLNWMAEQDPTVWETLSDSVLEKLSATELEQLPAEVQARVQ